KPGLQTSPGPVRAPAPDEKQAELELQKLMARPVNDQLHQELLDFRMRYAGTSQAARATRLLTELPSSLDLLSLGRVEGPLPGPLQVGFPIAHLKLHPNCSTVAYAGVDRNTVVFHAWEAKGWPVIETRSDIRALAFAPDGKRLAFGESSKVRLYDL